MIDYKQELESLLNRFIHFNVVSYREFNLKRVKFVFNKFNLKKNVNKTKIIHIAGTNGKGSVSYMLSSVLYKSGYKVGLYTSPHLYELNERIRINNKKISYEDFYFIAKKIKPIIDIVDKSLGEITYFEYITLIALYYFFTSDLDFIILETGLGGRLDATNIFENKISVITSISLDHTRILGNNILDIAKEKLAIVKNGCPVFVSVQKRDVKDFIFRNYKNVYYFTDYIKILDYKLSLENGLYLKIKVENNIYEFNFKFIALYQVINISLVLLILNYLIKLGYKVKIDYIEDVLWEGRGEIISKKPYILLDGAHNKSGSMYLKNTLKLLKGQFNRLYVIISVLKGKDIESIFSNLLLLADEVILTLVKDNYRALKLQDLYNLAIKFNKNVRGFRNSDKALKYVLDKLEDDDLLIITGSLYLVGELRKKLKEVLDDPYFRCRK